ncbi:MAG TPA: response regulator [Chitinophagaceae bacterium]|nr:response regulator [Chitinophagaceae bacterium]
MKTILVIDDNAGIRENTAEILELAGYRVLTAEDGKKGVDAAIRQQPDLIVCDIMMPELDGYGVLHLVRKNTASAATPFIFLTAKTERADLRKGMEMGADDYITKPFDDLELLNAIETRLKKAGVLEAKYQPTAEGISQFIKDVKGSGQLASLADQYPATVVGRKQVIYQEGKRPRYLYYIVSGKIKTVRTTDEGKEYITNLFSEGDFLGYASLIEDKSYEDSAIVLEDTELLQVPREDFMQMIYTDMQVAAKFIRIMTHDVKEKEDRLMRLAYTSLRKRVANALAAIHQKFNTGEPGKAIEISREDIAHYVGTATESLIRTLSDFKSEGLIEIKQGKIFISDITKLDNLLY